MSMIPDEKPSTAHGIGHNQPPSPIEILVAAQREAQTQEKAARLAYIVGRAHAKAITDRETAGQAGDIIKVAGEFEDIVEKDRIERTRPYRDAADAAKAECDRFLDPLREAVQNLRDRLKAWSDEEDARISAQQAEQEAFFAKKDVDQPKPAEAPETKPSAPLQMRPAKRRKIVGDLGARVSQVDKKTFRVIDVHAVPDIILNSSTVHDAIIQVAKSMARHMPEIAGIEVEISSDNQIR